MTTLKYNGKEYNVVYIDPSIAAAGDGTSYDKALDNFPTSLSDNTCYLIRRTNEEYKVDMKPTKNTGLTYIMLMGMPRKGEELYDLLDDEDVKTAWEDATSKYANITMNSTSYNRHSGDSGAMPYVVFWENSIEDFSATNCYFFRNSDSGSSQYHLQPMFYFNRYDLVQKIKFNGCKFGYTQYDFEDDDFLANNETITADTTKYPQNKCCGYVSIGRSALTHFEKCIINIVRTDGNGTSYSDHAYNGGPADYPKSIYSNNSQVNFVMKDCQVNILHYSTQDSSYGCYYNDIMIDRSGEGVATDNGSDNSYPYKRYSNINIDGMEINHIMMGDKGIHDLHSIAVNGKFVKINNIKINIKNMKNASNGILRRYDERSWAILVGKYDNYGSDNDGHPPLIIKVNNIKADFTKNPLFRPNSARILYIQGLSIDHGNMSSCVENIDIRFPHDNFTVSPNVYVVMFRNYPYTSNYNNWSIGSDNSAADYYRNASKGVIYKNIRIDSPYNTSYSLYMTGASVKSPYIGGKIYLRSSTLEVDKIYTGVPASSCVTMSYNSYLKCDEFEANLNNKNSPYVGVAQIVLNSQDPSSVYVNKTNIALFDEIPVTANYSLAMNGSYVCPNYIVNGQYFARNSQIFVKSWNSVRTGSTSQASLKLYNNTSTAAGNPGYLIIGNDPYKGIEIQPKSAGKKILTCYIAVKNFDETQYHEGSTHCGITACVPETRNDNGEMNIYTYTSMGSSWKEDLSTWSNDNNLKTYRIEIPLEVKEITNPIDVKIWYNWYSANGYVYIDPDIKLIDVVEE